MSAGTRTAPASSFRCLSRGPSSRAAAWRRWASRRAPRSAPSSARPHRKVICLVGDGGLLSAVGALCDGGRARRPVLFVLFNNFCFSTIRTVGIDLLQQQLRHGVHDARRRSRTTPTFRCWPRPSAWGRPGHRSRRSRAGAQEGAGDRSAVPARSADARRRPHAAHGPLGHRGVPEARQRLIRARSARADAMTEMNRRELLQLGAAAIGATALPSIARGQDAAAPRAAAVAREARSASTPIRGRCIGCESPKKSPPPVTRSATRRSTSRSGTIPGTCSPKRPKRICRSG